MPELTKGKHGVNIAGEPLPCPLCGQVEEAWAIDSKRGETYHRCGQCELIWIPREFHIDRDAERAHYELHENSPEDPRYRKFLSQLWDPLEAMLQPGDHGLDYGSGPGPTLNLMASERGFPCANYDPFFAPHPEVLQTHYNFITCSETAEHFSDPGKEFSRLHELLLPGGWLGLMTLRPEVRTPDDFLAWHYRRETTHVSFYSDSCVRWIADRYGWQTLELVSPRVALFRKPG